MGENVTTGRPFLGIMFDCCQVYSRVYRHHSGEFYAGRCPKCMRTLRFRVNAEGGSGKRFWRVK